MQAAAGLEYHMATKGSRTFGEAEQYCSKLGGGAHLASISHEDEKVAMNGAFVDDMSSYTDVWIGLTNYDMFNDRTTAGSFMWTDGRPFSGPAAWWSWDVAADPALPKFDGKKLCTYVATKKGFSWAVGLCDEEKKEFAMCERYENACLAQSQFSENGGCGAVGGQGTGTGDGLCLNQMNGKYYCACPPGQMLMPWVAGEGQHHCTDCQSFGDDEYCTFFLAGDSSHCTRPKCSGDS
jgi:hypothetical protein